MDDEHGIEDNSSQVPKSAILLIIVCAIAAVFGYVFVQWIESRRNCNLNEFDNSRNTVSTNQNGSGVTNVLSRTERRQMQRMVTRQNSINVNLKVRAWMDENHLSLLYYDDEDASPRNVTTASTGIAGAGPTTKDTTNMDALRKMSQLRTEQHVMDEESSSLYNECAICLCSFECNEIICESNHSDCIHTFHADCMKQWLIQHQGCPICRVAYLDVVAS